MLALCPVHGKSRNKGVDLVQRIWAGILISALVGSLSCTNSGNRRGRTPPSGSLESAFNSGNLSLIQLTSAIRSNVSPGSLLDLLGDGSNAIGSVCTPSEDPNAVPGSSSCRCLISYTIPGGSSESYEVDTSYVEANMARCAYGGGAIRGDVEQMTLALVHTPSGQVSNGLIINLTQFRETVDLSQASSYRLVKPFQCRDRFGIPNLFDPTVYDPYRSELTKLFYPITFYHTNYGAALIAHAQKNAENPDFYAGWECSMDEQRPKFWENPYVFSLAPDANGSHVISPHSGTNFNRRDFHLARHRSGVFNIPFHSFIGPAIITTTPDAAGNVPSGTHSPIGWAAASIPQGSGETCPNVTIPTGYHWVKVWAFRSSTPARRFVSNTDQTRNWPQIICNPGLWPNINAGTPDKNVFRDCRRVTAVGQADPDQTTLPLLDYDPANPDYLAARIFGHSNIPGQFVCAALTSSNATPTTFPANYVSVAGRSPEVNIPGADFYERVGGDNGRNAFEMPFNLDPPREPAGVASFDPGARQTPIDANTNEFARGDLDAGQDRYEYLFTVSPVTISYREVEQESPNAQPYIPYSYYSARDCLPTQAGFPGTCNIGRKKPRFGIVSAVSTDPNANSGTGERVFPLCALQPD